MRAIVNVNKDWGIGCDGDLLINIPEDMKYFRSATKGCAVIMGRKTLDSFPGKKPLKGRINIVLTADPSRISNESISAADTYYEVNNGTSSGEIKTIFEDIVEKSKKNRGLSERGVKASEMHTLLIAVTGRQEALWIAGNIEKAVGSDRVYVIGGASIYEMFLSDCDTCLVTENDCGFKPDTFFPRLDKMPGWRLEILGEERIYEDVHFRFNTYVRV